MATFVTFKPANSEKLSEDEPVLKYKLLTSKAYPPTRETTGSIGYDLRSPRFARIPPKGGTYYLPLGIAFQIPEGHYGRLAPKSGLAIYVLLRLRVQNRRKKWNFLPNFRNGII